MALILAVEKGNQDIVEFLASKGASIDIPYKAVLKLP